MKNKVLEMWSCVEHKAAVRMDNCCTNAVVTGYIEVVGVEVERLGPNVEEDKATGS